MPVTVCSACRRRVILVDGLCPVCGAMGASRRPAAPAREQVPFRRPTPAPRGPAAAAPEPGYADAPAPGFADAPAPGFADAPDPGYADLPEAGDLEREATRAAMEGFVAGDVPPELDDGDTDPSAPPPVYDEGAAEHDEADYADAGAPAPEQRYPSDPYAIPEGIGGPAPLLPKPRPNTRTSPAEKSEAPPRRRQTVLGWLLLTLAYAVAAVIGVTVEYFNSDGYEVNARLDEADALFGDDQGRGVPGDQLLAAAEAYLSALTIDPNILYAHQALESIRWRFQERNEEFPRILMQRHAAVAAVSMWAEEPGAFSELPVSLDEQYGISDAKARAKKHAFWWGIGFVLLLAWTLLRWAWIRIHPEDRELVERDDSALF